MLTVEFHYVESSLLLAHLYEGDEKQQESVVHAFPAERHQSTGKIEPSAAISPTHELPDRSTKHLPVIVLALLGAGNTQ